MIRFTLIFQDFKPLGYKKSNNAQIFLPNVLFFEKNYLIKII